MFGFGYETATLWPVRMRVSMSWDNYYTCFDLKERFSIYLHLFSFQLLRIYLYISFVSFILSCSRCYCF